MAAMICKRPPHRGQCSENEARHQEKRRIMLLDLKHLFDLWVEHYAKIPDPERSLLPLKAVWFLALSDAG